jgi:hypothetical protein
MQAGQVYEIFVDCTRNDLVTIGDIADEIVSQLNEKLGITTRWEQYSRSGHNFIRIYLPSPDLKMHDRTQFIALYFAGTASASKSDDTYSDSFLVACFYNSEYVNCSGVLSHRYYIGSENYSTPTGLYLKTGQLTLRIDTTMWTEQNNFYHIYGLMTTNYSGVESLPSNVKFTYPMFVTKIKKSNPDVEYDIFIRAGATTIFWAATPSDIATITPTEQPSETSITLHKIFSGAYENDYWYWLRAGDNSTVKEYISYSRFPSIESDNRKIKSLNDEYDAFLLQEGAGSVDGQSLVIKKP